MDLSIRARDHTISAQPQLMSSLTGEDAGAMMSAPTLLQQPSPVFAGAQPWLPTDDVEEEDATYRFRKMKMFEMAPSDDPETEERRQRALYAKNNRDMKKREVANLQREAAALRAAKEQYQADLTRVYDMVQCQQHQLQELEQCLLDSRQQLKDKEEHIRNRRKKMSRVKAHVEVIAAGLNEENGESRQMLLNLAAQV